MISPSPSWVDLFLVVPEAHRDIFDLEAQATWYEVYHRDWRNRLAHAIAMPIIVWSLLVLAGLGAGAALGDPAARFGALAVAVPLNLCYLRQDRVVGLAMAPVLIAFSIAAALFVVAAGDVALPATLGLLASASAVQTFAHGFEPEVPPPVSGTGGWLPRRAWIEGAPRSQVALSIALGCTVYVLVELSSSPRLLSVQVARLLERLGLRPPLRPSLRALEVARVAPAGPLERARAA
jgi:uncharacterized membrane protein YGL010W